MVVIPKKKGYIETFLISFSFTNTMQMPFFSDFSCLSKNIYIPPFSAVELFTPAQYVYLGANPKRQLEFKMTVTVVYT